MKKFFWAFNVLWTMLFLGGVSMAAVPPKIEELLASTYPPAMPSKALDTAHYDLNIDTLKGYVVMEQGGIPAERARFFIEWQEYDYRGVVVHLDEDNKVTTRRGSPYCYLQRGDVLAVAGMKIFNRTVYLKLITPKIYIPELRSTEKRYSRVTVMLGFRLPKEIYNSDDASAAIELIEKWLKPFKDYDSAAAYALTIRAQAALTEVEKELTLEEKAAKNVKTSDKTREEKIENLESKIEAAQREMEEAQKQMEELKKQMK